MAIASAVITGLFVSFIVGYKFGLVFKYIKQFGEKI